MTDFLLEDLSQFRDISGLSLCQTLTGLLDMSPEEALKIAG